MKFETQKSVVLEHLKHNHSITSWGAIQEYHITRLSAVIYDLRADGYEIQTIREYNEETGSNYARYILLKSKAWDEEDLLNLPKEEFLSKFDISDEDYEMEHKKFQEM